VIRKSISILLLVVFMFDAGGMIFGLQVRQWIHKIAVAAIIEADSFRGDIITIRMSAEEFRKVKVHDREFKLHDDMYDVVWSETVNDQLVLYCIRDNAEENMVAEFLGFMAKSTNEKASTSVSLVQSVLIGFIFFTPEQHYILQAYTDIVEYPSFHNDRMLCRGSHVELPPPRVASV
jgi:uncharacterized protein (DUF2235 family)